MKHAGGKGGNKRRLKIMEGKHHDKKPKYSRKSREVKQLLLRLTRNWI
jgi:hypothetical protein